MPRVSTSNGKAGIKYRLGLVIDLLKMIFHYGFIPMVVYLGYKKGANKDMAPFTPMTILWHTQ